MLDQRRRRWANIQPTLCQRLVIARDVTREQLYISDVGAINYTQSITCALLSPLFYFW